MHLERYILSNSIVNIFICNDIFIGSFNSHYMCTFLFLAKPLELPPQVFEQSDDDSEKEQEMDIRTDAFFDGMLLVTQYFSHEISSYHIF